LAGTALMPMIKQRQRVVAEGNEGRTAAEQFYALASSSSCRLALLTPHRLLMDMCDTPLLLRSFPQRYWCTWCAITT